MNFELRQDGFQKPEDRITANSFKEGLLPVSIHCDKGCEMTHDQLINCTTEFINEFVSDIPVELDHAVCDGDECIGGEGEALYRKVNTLARPKKGGDR